VWATITLTLLALTRTLTPRNTLTAAHDHRLEVARALTHTSTLSNTYSTVTMARARHLMPTAAITVTRAPNRTRAVTQRLNPNNSRGRSMTLIITLSLTSAPPLSLTLQLAATPTLAIALTRTPSLSMARLLL